MARRKAKRAPSGAVDVVNRVYDLARATSPKEAAQLLGVSRSSVYRAMKTARTRGPVRDILAKPETLKAWQGRLQGAAVKTMTGQIEAAEAGKAPPRRAKEAADIISTATGEKWSYQKVSGMTRKFKIPTPAPRAAPPKEGAPPVPDRPDFGRMLWEQMKPTVSPKEIDKFTRADFDKGLTTHYRDKGIRYMSAGQEWIDADGSRRPLLEQRATWQTREEVENYIKDIGLNKEMLVVEIFVDEWGDEYYIVYLDYEGED